jgi:hypothetical protein
MTATFLGCHPFLCCVVTQIYPVGPRIRFGKLFDLWFALRRRLLAARFLQRLHLVEIHANEESNPTTKLAGTFSD